MPEAITIRIPRPAIDAIVASLEGYLGLAPSLGVDPRTGRVVVSLPPGVLTDGTMTVRVGPIPIPVHCRRHAQWHAISHVAFDGSRIHSALHLPAVHGLAIAAITMLAPAPAEAEMMARDYRNAWDCLLAPLQERLQSQTEDTLSALLDAVCLLPEALRAATGLPIHEALRPLAEARFPERSHPIWADLEVTPDTHVLPRLRHDPARASLGIPTLRPNDFRTMQVDDATAALAARISSTCDEVDLRLQGFHRHRPQQQHPLQHRGHPAALSAAVYKGLAAGMRAALLPDPEFALSALAEADPE
jgi:hypothetical protein